MTQCSNCLVETDESKPSEFGPICPACIKVYGDPEDGGADRSPAVFNETIELLQSHVHVRLVDVQRLVDSAAETAEEDGETYTTSALQTLREKLGRLDTCVVKR